MSTGPDKTRRRRGHDPSGVIVGGGALAVGLAGGAAAGFGIAKATEDEAAETTAEAASAQFVKPEGTTLKVFETELGTPWYDQTSWGTSHDLFFVRNRYATPTVDPDSWELKVSGDAIENELTLSFDELRALPSRTARAFSSASATAAPSTGSSWATRSRAATGASAPSARASGTTSPSGRSSTACSRRPRRCSCCSGAASTAPTPGARSRWRPSSSAPTTSVSPSG